MAHDKLMVVLAVMATTFSMASMLFTASIAMKCNDKLTRKIEEFFGCEIAER